MITFMEGQNSILDLESKEVPRMGQIVYIEGKYYKVLNIVSSYAKGDFSSTVNHNVYLEYLGGESLNLKDVIE